MKALIQSKGLGWFHEVENAGITVFRNNDKHSLNSVSLLISFSILALYVSSSFGRKGVY